MLSCVGDLVHNLAIADDQSVTEAFKTTDDYLSSQMTHDEEEEKGFNRTVINTSRDTEREDNPNMNTEAGTYLLDHLFILSSFLCLFVH